jgi:hypothetical protein
VTLKLQFAYYYSKNMTDFPSVRLAFKRAVSMSTGISSLNVVIAQSNQEELCAIPIAQHQIQNMYQKRKILLNELLYSSISFSIVSNVQGIIFLFAFIKKYLICFIRHIFFSF